MKVVCIKNGMEKNADKLTIGKTYLTIIIDNSSKIKRYAISNDAGVNWWYNQNLFNTIDEIREKKLNELGI